MATFTASSEKFRLALKILVETMWVGGAKAGGGEKADNKWLSPLEGKRAGVWNYIPMANTI